MKSKKEIDLWKEMYELTSGMCKESGQCKGRGFCCDLFYCDKAQQEAEDDGVELEVVGDKNTPFKGPSGCVVPPHYRSYCTLHQCRLDFANNIQFQKYWAVRQKLNNLSWKRMDDGSIITNKDGSIKRKRK